MKSYPSIPRSTGQMFFEIPNAYLFAKLDGQQIRIRWSKKQRWHLFGTKNTVFDATDKLFGNTIELFHDIGLADQIEEVAVNNGWREIVAYCELYGPHSFAGRHDPNDAMTLVLFDVNVHKQGILGPKEFLKLFKYVPKAEFIGQANFTRGFVKRVFDGEIEGASFEGVVAKAGEGHKLVMAKAKTRAWLEKIKSMYTADEAEILINS